MVPGRAYVAVARVTVVEDDPQGRTHAYAYVSDFLEFPHLVQFASAGRYAETPLRAIGDSAKVGVYLRGRSIRELSDEDFAEIVRGGN